MSKLRCRMGVAVLGAAAVVAIGGGSTAAAASDPRAVELADRLLEALGGDAAWQETRFLRFNFFGARTHHWDRVTGRHRLEGRSREGQSYVVLHNLHDRSGEVWVDGERLEGEAAAGWLERAYGAWVNDTYWLLMPYKLRDPGVTLHAEGTAELEGREYQVVRLTFDSVGLTPGDQYWAYLNPETGLMEAWAYHLESWEPDRERTLWWWRDWQRHGGILLASLRVNAGDGSERSLSDIAVFNELADSVFTTP